MFTTFAAFDDLTRAVLNAKRRTLHDLVARRIEQEPPCTERLVARLEDEINHMEDARLVWHAKSLTDRGRGSQEQEYGADFLGVLSIFTREFKVSKGFLAQAKLIEPDEAFSTGEVDRLREQCDKMLRITPDSFVFLYSRRDITVVPALTVISSTRHRNPHDFDSASLEAFFGDHAICFVGDQRIRAADISELERIRGEHRVRSALLLSAETEQRENA